MDYTTQMDSITASLAEISNNISALAGVIGTLTSSLTDMRDDMNELVKLANDGGIVTRPYNADIQAALLRMTLADANQIDRFKLAKEEYKIDPVV